MKPIILSDYQCNILRRAVALRDDYSCILCGASGNDTHHLLFRSYTGKGNALIWQLPNMCVLCIKCHAEAHAHGSVMRDVLLRKLMELYNYDYYNLEPFNQYLIGKLDKNEVL